MRLTDIHPGDWGIVTGFSHHTDLRRRFQDLGIICGTKIKCISKSPLGDPTAYLIRRTVIALRSTDASQIYVREVSP